MKNFSKIFWMISILFLGCIIVIRSAPIATAWGDNGGGRESFTAAQIDGGILGNTIVFNSVSDNPIGNEKNFVGAREYTGQNAGVQNIWNGNEIQVADGQQYLVRLYVHNNNPNGVEAVSHNTRVAFNIPEPTVSDKTLQINGYIYSDNAAPSEYWDYVNFVSNQPFHLEYIYGSALIENHGYASAVNGGAKPLSDNIVTKAASEHGVPIGYEKEGDGEIPGGINYECYIVIRVKVVFDYEFGAESKVRLAGESAWQESIIASANDVIEFSIHYENIDKLPQENIHVYNALPDSLHYIEGSATIETNELIATTLNTDIFSNQGVNIGSYASGESATITFSAQVAEKNASDITDTLVNWTQIGVGSTFQQSYTTIMVEEDNRNLLVLLDIVIIVSALIIILLLYILIKRKHNPD